MSEAMDAYLDLIDYDEAEHQTSTERPMTTFDKSKAVDAEVVTPAPVQPATQQTQALAVRDTGGAVDKALSVDELRANLEFIRTVMQDVMKEGQDFGKVPGCGDKPGLFQPGAQKLLMTFQLTDEIKEEKVTDFPNFHREYSFVVRLVSKTGRHWEGVGTCSTLEGKYRYRKAERRCPECGKNAIIQGKAEYGGGWLCFKKKGGCGAKFGEKAPEIISQPGGTVENENPADYWNTVRKMAFKRALVHAAINATNTSELWSQDLEDLPDKGARDDEDGGYIPQEPKQAPPRQQAPPAKPKTVLVPRPTAESRAKMINALMAGAGQANREIVHEYFVKAGQLLPTETVEDLPLRFVPGTGKQMQALHAAIDAFVQGEEAKAAFEPNEEPTEPKKTKAAQKPIEVPRDPATDTNPPEHPNEWFFDVVCPIPRRGMKKADYLRNPDTIGSLYDARHGTDDLAQEARQRLFGFVNNFEPKPWVKTNGDEVPPSAADFTFRKALDAFAAWFEREHPDEKL